MTGQNLRGLGMYTSGGEIADKCMPKGMKISHTFRVNTVHQEVEDKIEKSALALSRSLFYLAK
jgi:hypothetical protein